MNNQQMDAILEKQRKFYQTGTTLSISFRVKMLKRLHSAVQKYEAEICAALKTDLGKSDFEGYMCEIGMVLEELSYMIRHTK